MTDPRDVRPSAGEWIAISILGVATILGPLALGCTFPWPRFALETAMVIVVVAWTWSGRATWRRSLPAIVAGLVILVQLVPLPVGLLSAISPTTAGLWKLALDDPTTSLLPLSVDPATTAASIRRLLIGFAVVSVVADLARHDVARRWLAACLAISSILILSLGLLVRPSLEDRRILGVIDLAGPIMFWKTPVHAPVETAGCSEPDWVTVGSRRYLADGWICGDRIGPFIVSNHFVNALCLTLPYAFAVWLAVSRPRTHSILAWGVAGAFLAVALYVSAAVAGSRAGTASLILTVLSGAAFVCHSGWLRRVALSIAAAAFALILFSATLLMTRAGWWMSLVPFSIKGYVAELLRNERFEYSRIAGRTFVGAPVFGTGLGTFGDLYDRLHGAERGSAFFAHNDYAQWLAETGAIGAGLAACLIVTLGTGLHRFVRQGVPRGSPLDAAPWAALAGLGAHSFFDWSLHIPANAMLAALSVGLALGGGGLSRSVEVPMATRRRRNLPGVLLTASCLIVALLLARDAWSETRQRSMRDAIAAARLAAGDPNLPSPEPALRSAYSAGAETARLDPASARVRVLLGQIDLHLAALAGDAEQAVRELTAADARFAEARRRSAVCRGLPEPAITPHGNGNPRP